jgi:hypothetical protein
MEEKEREKEIDVRNWLTSFWRLAYLKLFL